MRRVSMIALVTLVALITTPAFAVSITLNDGGTSDIRSAAYDGATTDDSNPYNPTSLPDSGTVDADAGGSSTTASSLFWNRQRSDTTPNESFKLGLEDGCRAIM